MERTSVASGASEVEMYDVLVAGGGPTGLMLAGELQLAGVNVLVLERRRSQELTGSRGGGIHARTLELLDQRGLVEAFLAEGTQIRGVTFAGSTLDLANLPTRHPYTLALFQNHIERLLRAWIDELGVSIRGGVAVAGIDAGESAVTVRLDSGEIVEAAYLVGADGGRSVVRRQAGIEFVGPDATRSSLIAEVEVSEDIPAAGKIDERGVHGLHRMADGFVRIVLTEATLSDTEPSIEDLRRGLTEVFGTDFGVRNPRWLSRFTDATRQAASYRRGRVLLAGDAAHVHSPTGGQGIGLGIQDAVNLGWKLGQVVRGASGDALLDSYQAERHPAGARALKYSMAQSLFQKADPRQEALRDLLDEVVKLPDASELVASMITGLDVAYDLGPGHPLLGRRMPDLDLTAADGPIRVYEMLHEARPVLLHLGGPALDGREIRVVTATYDGSWVLPALGEVPAPTAVLIRPDGYVGWVGEGSTAELGTALRTWCGDPVP